MVWVLERGVPWGARGPEAARALAVEGARVGGFASRRARRVDLAGRCVLPGLVNGHDHLGFASFPPLGRPPYPSVYAWADDVRAGIGDPRAEDALCVALPDRLLLGAVRNLLAGVTTVVHHDPWDATLARTGAGAWRFALGLLRRHGVRLRGGFPLRVLHRYAHAHSPGLTPDLGATRPRSARVPWMLHAAEGTDAQARAEIAQLAAGGLLRANTVLVHALAATAADAVEIAAAGAGVVWCPESNRHLYGASAPVDVLRAAGVRLGLGSDSPLSGVRDALSNLAAARRTDVFDDRALLQLATRDTAALFGLPSGGVEPGAAADLVVVDDVARLLRGERHAVHLVLVAGRALYGIPELMDACDVPAHDIQVEGRRRKLEAGLALFLKRVQAAHPGLAQVSWLQDVHAE